MTTPMRPDELQQTAAALEGASNSMDGGYSMTKNPAYRDPDPSKFPFTPVKAPQPSAAFKLVYLKGLGGQAIPWIEKADGTKRLASAEEEQMWNRIVELEKRIDSLLPHVGPEGDTNLIPREPEQSETKKSKKKP